MVMKYIVTIWTNYGSNNSDAFTLKSEKPLAGITEITVTNIDANTEWVRVVGEKALPAVELF
jgi:iron complex outermembrane receptor protein